jgi:hypothetical protein
MVPRGPLALLVQLFLANPCSFHVVHKHRLSAHSSLPIFLNASPRSLRTWTLHTTVSSDNHTTWIMVEQSGNSIDVPRPTASSSVTPSSAVHPRPQPDQAAPNTSSVFHDPTNPLVTVGFYGAYTWDDINGYYNRYRTGT